MSRVLQGRDAVRRFEMMDFEAEAGRIHAQANTRARSVIADAQRQAGEIKGQAHRDGYAAGLKEGGEAGLKEGRETGARKAEEEFAARSRDLTAVLEGVLSEFTARREAILEQVRKDALEFLVTCVERIVRREAALDKATARRALLDGLSMVTSSPVTVEVNVSDLDYLRRILPEIMAESPVDGISVAAADGLEHGDVRITHPEGAVDMSVSAQINLIRSAFAGGSDAAV